MESRSLNSEVLAVMLCSCCLKISIAALQPFPTKTTQMKLTLLGYLGSGHSSCRGFLCPDNLDKSLSSAT